jgi:hypothetical protein
MSIFAMRHANGEWFKLDCKWHYRIPIFRSRRAALNARSSNPGMQMFRPEMLNEGLMPDIKPSADRNATYFWLVDIGSTDMGRGHLLEVGEFASLVDEAVTNE